MHTRYWLDVQANTAHRQYYYVSIDIDAASAAAAIVKYAPTIAFTHLFIYLYC